MTWLRVDDTALTHERTLHLRTLADPIATAEAVIGWVMLAASWSGQQNSDGYVPEGAGRFASPEHWQQLAAFALKVGLIQRANAAVRKDHGGQAGWVVVMGDGEVFHLLSRKELELRREKRNITRRIPEKVATLLRDGDQCRYCADPVNQYDRKGAKRREFDHPDPQDASVVVVACLECNSSKQGRTVDEWVADGGRPLLPTPVERGLDVYLRPTTTAWLAKHHAPLPDQAAAQAPAGVARPGPAPAPAATRPAADQAREQPSSTNTPDNINGEPEPPDTRVTIAGRDMPGRVGPGRVGSGPPAPDPAGSRARDGPRRRGSRGRRGRARPA